jgi:LCP family protein required for cell wall assembly
MKQPTHSIDGFVPRRPSRQVGGRISPGAPAASGAAGLAQHNPAVPLDESSVQAPVLTRTEHGLTRRDIDDSLKDIDTQLPEQKKKRFGRKGLPKSRTRRIVFWVVLTLVVLGVAIGGFLAWRAFNAGNSIFKGNILSVFEGKPLKEDANGRSNFLVLGTSEDDPGHAGGNLTDSMMVVSINQKDKSVAMFSVPRDLEVEYGELCAPGNAGKINAYFSCADEGTTDEAEQNRLAKTQKLIGEIFGLDIQYGVHVNNTVIKESVDAVGGVDVDIQGSNGDPGVFDRNFDWRCNYKCYYVKYDNGVHHLDGEHALFFSMARGSVMPTYGLGNSNFDREKNQQKVILALKEKAVSSGTLTNIGKISSLIDAMGDNLRTNIDASEIKTLAQLGVDIKSENIRHISLTEDGSQVVKTGNINGASVVMPVAGMYEYGQIQRYIAKKLTADPVALEEANIVVLNGSGVAGVAQQEADSLEAKGMTISGVDNAPEGDYGKATIYQVGTGMPATKAKLESIYGVTVKTTTPPVTVTGDTNFVVIIGQASTSQSQ